MIRWEQKAQTSIFLNFLEKNLNIMNLDKVFIETRL